VEYFDILKYFLIMEAALGVLMLGAIYVICIVKRNEINFTMGDFVYFVARNLFVLPLRIKNNIQERKKYGNNKKQMPIKDICNILGKTIFCIIFYWFIIYKMFEIYQHQG